MAHSVLGEALTRTFIVWAWQDYIAVPVPHTSSVLGKTAVLPGWITEVFI